MDGKQFYKQVDEDPTLEWLGAREGKTPEDDDVVIRYKPTAAKFAVSILAILKNSWADLYAVLSGRRSPRIMKHITE